MTERGSLLVLLHAHLPFVRNPEYQRFLEENWLFEAISETYLPLIRVFEGLEADGVPFKLTLCISPTLCAMLEDELLQRRYIHHLDMLIELAEKELERLADNQAFLPVAEMYHRLFLRNRTDFVDRFERRILRSLDGWVKNGRVELVSTAATHAYLPLYEGFPAAVRMQIQLALQTHHRSFGKAPRGFWLPECGYFPGVEKYLAEVGVRYFFAATHGILLADHKPPAGVYAPVACPNGVVAFGRDLQSTNAVWAPEEGYPGDPVYRDFYRDIGFDLPLEYVAPYIHDARVRVFTGFKYYATSGRSAEKRPYEPEAAALRAKQHADNFVYNRRQQIRTLAAHMDRPPLVTCTFDAELFGHWWFEGPLWIDALFRALSDAPGIDLVTPNEYLKASGALAKVQPALSSWGNKGYSEVWLDGSNDWVYRHTQKAVDRMCELVQRYPNEQGLKLRALNQAAREVLLSQASDWPFIMHTGTTVPYAVNRVKEHIANFNRIYDALSSGAISTEWLTRIERKNNIFPDIDYRLWTSAPTLTQ